MQKINYICKKIFMAKSKEFNNDGIIKITSSHALKKKLWDLYKDTGMTMTRHVKKALIEYTNKNKKEA